MPDVHVPQLDDADERDGAVQLPAPTGVESAAEPPARPLSGAPLRARRSRGHGIGRILLEVLLISLGVFLGLAGEQWREAVRHRELADAALRRFREEIAANQKAVASVKDYHIVTQTALGRYLAADAATRRNSEFRLAGIQPAEFEHAAWDLALATQSLADINPDVALSLTHAYSLQQRYTATTAALVSAMYIRPPGDPKDAEGFLRALQVYYGDVVVYEPELLQMYDTLLPEIDRELGHAGKD